MTLIEERLHLPEYANFIDSIADLDLEMSVSELHGVICGYLCAGVDNQGHAYLRALLNNKKIAASSPAGLALFAVFSISQQQISTFDFEFEMLLPDDRESLADRALAFSKWCEGFTRSLAIADIGFEAFDEEEGQEALQYLLEFSELDCDALDIDEEDEKALMEISEYARMAVIRLHGDLMMNRKKGGSQGTAH